MGGIELCELVTDRNFDEEAYLLENADVRQAVRNGQCKSGRQHFDVFGKKERRRQRLASRDLLGAVGAQRAQKLEKLTSRIRWDMPHEVVDGKLDFLTESLRAETRIIDTENVSSHDYDADIVSLVDKYADGILLDCGSGRRNTYFSNVINYEIVNYDTTDVIGVGEYLPFEDATFDAVISVAVLEHVRDPFRCAREISRVLKPGGELFCSVPFLQPLHGYPHHYFNATPQGIRRLFEDALDVESVYVNGATHPIAAVSWILNSWASGLTGKTQRQFKDMRVADLLDVPGAYVEMPFCTELSEDKKLELACATILRATKR